MKEEKKCNIKVNLCGVELKNPIIAASGTFGYGAEYEKFIKLSDLGGISTKGTTLNPRLGNPPPRVAETYMGMINSVGLENPGIDYFINNHLPNLLEKNTAIIVNIAGGTVKEYGEIAKKLDETKIDMIEINISCPNVKEGGAAFGVSCDNVAKVVSEVRKKTKKPLMVKLSPNVTSIKDIAKVAQRNGADCISVINTILGMRIDIKTRQPILKNNLGGLSGPAVFPIALRAVWEVKNAVSIPVVGLGGITKWQDAVEMMMAGASAIQIGTGFFNNVNVASEVIEGIKEFMYNENVRDIKDLVGMVKIHSI